MHKTILLISVLFCFTIGLKAQNYAESISVNFFLLDECKISINMTTEIKTVFNTYQSERFSFTAYFPNFASNEENIRSFKKDYQIPFDCVSDYEKKRSKLLGATVAPEVVVYDEVNKEILYRGRIDNSYFEVGNRRRVITQRDLNEVLKNILANHKIENKETEAIGCFINYKEVD